MLSSGVSSLVSLLVLSVGSQIASAVPIDLLEERSGEGCNANNVLRSFRATQRLADTLPFCSDFLGLPKITQTAAFVPTASVTVTQTMTITTLATETETKTVISFEKRAISTPSFILTQSLEPSVISSACNCLTIPLATTTFTPSGVTSFSQTATETVTSYVTETATVTNVASSLVLASPTAIAGNTNGVAPYDVDDAYDRIELDFEVEVYGFKSNLIFIGTNGLLWLDENSLGAFQIFYTDSPGSLPKGPVELPDIAILPFWADLLVKEGAFQGIFYEVTGSSGSHVVTFEYLVTSYDDKSVTYHYTVAFAEAEPNKVKVEFIEVTDSTIGTVAIQHASSNQVVLYSRNGNTVTNGLTLEFDTAAGTVN
jgi:hypothetical protein